MKNVLAKSAQSVQDVLDRENVNTKVMELPCSTRTAADAANTIGCKLGQIVKSLIFKTKNSEDPILVLVSGFNQLSESALEECVGQQIQKADAAYARNITGFAIGGIPPIGHKHSIKRIYIDQDLLNHEEVWAAAGTPNAVFAIRSKDLVNLTNGKVGKIGRCA